MPSSQLRCDKEHFLRSPFSKEHQQKVLKIRVKTTRSCEGVCFLTCLRNESEGQAVTSLRFTWSKKPLVSIPCTAFIKSVFVFSVLQVTIQGWCFGKNCKVETLVFAEQDLTKFPFISPCCQRERTKSRLKHQKSTFENTAWWVFCMDNPSISGHFRQEYTNFTFCSIRKSYAWEESELFRLCFFVLWCLMMLNWKNGSSFFPYLTSQTPNLCPCKWKMKATVFWILQNAEAEGRQISHGVKSVDQTANVRLSFVGCPRSRRAVSRKVQRRSQKRKPNSLFWRQSRALDLWCWWCCLKLCLCKATPSLLKIDRCWKPIHKLHLCKKKGDRFF